MIRPLAVVLLVVASPTLAGDRPERVVLEPQPVSWRPEPLSTEALQALAITGGAVTAIAIIAAVIGVTVSRGSTGLRFPNCLTTGGSSACGGH